MKSAIIASTLAGAFAVAPPKIELDLSDLNLDNHPGGQLLSASLERPHDLGYTQPNGDQVMSRQDWSERCPAGTGTNPTNCPFPVARAFDHQDESVEVTTRVFKVDVNGTPCDAEPDACSCNAMTNGGADIDAGDNCEITQIDFEQRSTYLFKYDAMDAAGNHAEQVVFALILDDSTDPILNLCNTNAETVEAASDWYLCTGVNANDNIDGSLTSEITYKIDKLDGANSAAICATSSYQDYIDYKASPDDFGGAMPCAKEHMETWMVGEYLIEFEVCDTATVYGAGGSSNCVTKEKAVQIIDRTAPSIEVIGASPKYHECTHDYTDPSVDVHDLLDTDFGGLGFPAEYQHTITPGTSWSPELNTGVPGTYAITYTASDHADNPATPQTRNVVVQDTTDPVAQLNSGMGETATHYVCDPNADDNTNVDNFHNQDDNFCLDFETNDAGASCEDACQGTLDVDMQWDRAFSDSVVGEYVRTYTCCDDYDNCHSVSRTFVIEDKERPIIQIMGEDNETYDASRTVEYTDKGATCQDYVDGVLSHAVEVSGQVVNMRIPGTYEINYDCQDLSGNPAHQMTRTVTIRDDSCPTITMLGNDVVYVEAGFDYEDAGATAEDDLDGDITPNVWTDGDQVNTGQAFYSRRSCREIKSEYPGASSGHYYITTLVEIGENPGFQRMEVYCDMHTTVNDLPVGFTYYECDGCKSIQPYGADAGDCPAFGLEMLQLTDHNSDSRDYMATWLTEEGKDADDYFPNAASNTTEYFCGTNDEALEEPHSWDGTDVAATNDHTLIDHEEISRAEAGKYIIHYHVSDSAGNPECEGGSPSRTVIVRDTLPPVITLHLKGDLIHTSAADQTGLGGESNEAADAAQYDSDNNAPASDVSGPTSFPHTGEYMAEEATTSSINGWVIGAIASTVSGLALLSYTLKQKTPVSVPV
jgi:hypothetical protein